MNLKNTTLGYKTNDAGDIVPLDPIGDKKLIDDLVAKFDDPNLAKLYPPEPPGVPFKYGTPPLPDKTFPSPEDLTPKDLASYSKARSQELKSQLTAKITMDSIDAAEVSEDVVRAVKSTSTSTSTKARLAEDTLNAIEVVQSNRLGYAAVAAGAGALVLGLGARNRKNSKKQL